MDRGTQLPAPPASVSEEPAQLAFEKLRELVVKKSVTVSSGSRKYAIQLNANTVAALERALSNTGKEVA